jgi:hypothetical protein
VILGAGVLLAFGASDASSATTAHRARWDTASRSTSIGSGSPRSAQSVTEAINEPELAAVGRGSSESSRPPIGYVALAAIVAAACAVRRRPNDGHVHSVRMLVSWLRSRAPPALSLI